MNAQTKMQTDGGGMWTIDYRKYDRIARARHRHPTDCDRGPRTDGDRRERRLAAWLMLRITPLHYWPLPTLSGPLVSGGVHLTTDIHPDYPGAQAMGRR